MVAVMPSNPSPLRDLATMLICVTVFAFNAILGAGDGFVGLSILTVVMLVVLAPYASTPMGGVALFTGITVFLVPLVALIYVDAGVWPGWLGLFTIVARALIAWSPRDIELPAMAHGAVINLAMVAVLLSFGLLLQVLGYNELFFHASWACSLIHLERLHAATPAKPMRLAGVAIVVGAVLVYSVTFWSGYGRLILSTFALAPVLLSVHYRTFRLPILAFAAFSASLVFLGRIIRFGVGDGIAGLADDSGASPLTLTQGFWDADVTIAWSEPFWHQWALLFLNWFPRDWWADKPVGINYTLVDAIWGRLGLGEEHSTAVSFLGEQVFLHSYLWPLTTALLVAVLILTWRFISKIAAPYFAPVVVFQSWMITFFWGGMATYGSRVWFSVVPMLVYLYVLRRIAHAPQSVDLPRTARA